MRWHSLPPADVPPSSHAGLRKQESASQETGGYGEDGAGHLDQAARFRGHPAAVRTDNGPGFTSKAFIGWTQKLPGAGSHCDIATMLNFRSPAQADQLRVATSSRE